MASSDKVKIALLEKIQMEAETIGNAIIERKKSEAVSVSLALQRNVNKLLQVFNDPDDDELIYKTKMPNPKSLIKTDR